MSFRIRGLASEQFTHLFAMTDAELAADGIIRCKVDREHAFPCRISLTDARPGEDVLLLAHLHHDVATPFRGEYAIYVRAGERQFDEVDVVPEQLRRRVLSLRAFDATGMMKGCRVVDGRELADPLATMFAQPDVAYVHIHFAAAGCYAARADRA